MLPVRSGWSVVETLRKEGILTPVLLLTARDTVPDRVKGLELGADDYLVKPFAFSELLARVRGSCGGDRRAVPGTPGRRRPGNRPDRHDPAPPAADPSSPPGIPSALPLWAAPGRSLTRTLMAEQVWDMNFDSDTNVVDVQSAGSAQRWMTLPGQADPHR